MALLPKSLLAASAPAKIALYLFFAAGLADGVLIPFFALWAQREAGVPTAHIGLLLGCYAGGELLATPLLGGIADRVGRRPVLLCSTLGVGLGFGLLYLTHGAWASAGALTLIGVFESVLHPTAFAVLGDVTEGTDARTRFALARVASGAGAVVGPALGAWLVRWSLGLVFAAAAVSLLTAAVVVAARLPETWRRGTAAPEDEEEDEESVLAFGAALRDGRLAALLAPVLLLQVAGSWIDAVLPLAAANAGTITPTGVGWLFTYAGLFTVCFQLPILHASGRLAVPALMLVSGGLLALAFGGLLASVALPFLVATVTLLACAQMLVDPVAQALVNELAPANSQATYMAAISVTNDLKDAAGPAVGTALYAVSAHLPWLVGLPVSVAASAGLSWVVHRHETAGRVASRGRA